MSIRGFMTETGVEKVDYNFTENKPMQRIVGDTGENQVILRHLASGVYVLSGQFRPFSGATQLAVFDGEMIAAINRQTDKSFIQILSPANNAIQHMEITDAECTVKTVELEENSEGPFITPEMFGAKGDGTTDDSAAIQAAIDAAGNTTPVYLSKRTYKLSAGLTINTRYAIFRCDGTLDYSGTDAAVTLGNLDCATVNIHTIRATNGIGVKLDGTAGGVRNCNIHVGFIRSSTIGLYLYTNGEPVYYNKIRIDSIESTETNVSVYADGGYINENWYWIGRISGGANCGLKLRASSAALAVGRNVFYTCDIEGIADTGTAIHLENAKGNEFRGLRCEEYYGAHSVVFNGVCSNNVVELSRITFQEVDISGLASGSDFNVLRCAKLGTGNYADAGYFAGTEAWVSYKHGITYDPRNANVYTAVESTTFADNEISTLEDRTIPTTLNFLASTNDLEFTLGAIYSEYGSLARGFPVVFKFGSARGFILLKDSRGGTILDNTSGAYASKTLSIRWNGYDKYTSENMWDIKELGATYATAETLEEKIENVPAEAFNLITPEMFGAVGDGVTDDSTAIQAAIDAAGSTKTCYLANKTYLIGSGLVINNNYADFRCDGMLRYDGDGATITLKGPMQRASVYVDMIYAENAEAVKLDGSSGSLTSNTVEVNCVRHSKCSLHIYTGGESAGSICYNKFKIAELVSSEVGVLVNCEASYITENWYYLGQIGGGCSIGAKLIGTGGSKFFSGSFEGIAADGVALYLENATGNIFENFRCEENYGKSCVKFVGSCTGNDIELSRIYLEQVDISEMGDIGGAYNTLRSPVITAGGRRAGTEARVNTRFGATYTPTYATSYVAVTPETYPDNIIVPINTEIATSLYFDATNDGETYTLGNLYSEYGSMARGFPVGIAFPVDAGKIILKDVNGDTILDNSDGEYSGFSYTVKWNGFDYNRNKNAWLVQSIYDPFATQKYVKDYAQPKGQYLTAETDPTVPAWAKATTKPDYTKAEVGLGNVDNVKQYSANNPPPYPVSSVNGKSGVVSLSASDVGAVPTTSVLTVTGVDADGVTHTWTMYGVTQ